MTDFLRHGIILAKRTARPQHDRRKGEKRARGDRGREQFGRKNYARRRDQDAHPRRDQRSHRRRRHRHRRKQSAGIYRQIRRRARRKPPFYRAFADEQGAQEDADDLDAEINNLKQNYDIIIIDTPGTYNHLSNAGHKNADILITPVNDSLLDLDVLAKFDVPNNFFSKSHYAQNVEKLKGLVSGENNLDQIIAKNFRWIVLRNRVSHVDANNKREVDKMLKYLSEKMGFEYLSGIGERVIYREMFLKGLTISDITNNKKLSSGISLSHVAAKNELNSVMTAIGIEDAKLKFA